MSEKETASGTPPQPRPGTTSDKDKQVQASKTGSPADARLLEDINLAMKLPIPETDDFWSMEEGRVLKGRQRLLKFFKKKELTEDELSTLRQEAESAPGRARVKIQMLTKKYAKSTALIMLGALCTYRMVMNSSNRKHVMEGLKSASRDAAYVLVNDGISLFNVETFFLIYFDYLAKVKRFQIATYKTLRETASYKASRKKLATSLKVCDSLLDEKNRAMKVLGQIKGKFKSSSYTVPWGFLDIQAAGKKVEQSEYKVICGPAEARETLVYSLALTDLFARIPILTPLVETLVKIVPESTTSLSLRKSAILITRMFTQLNIAIQEENMEKKRALGRQIFQSSNENIKRIANKPIKQSYEADPYFFLSRVALLTFGSYNAKEQKIILLSSLKAMQHAAKLDLTKNHVYTESAQNMARKISNLLSEESEKDSAEKQHDNE